MSWRCTKCDWSGPYEECFHVMYSGVDWEQCPSCRSVALLAVGSRQIEEALKQIAEIKMDRFSGTEYTKMTKPLVIRGMQFACYVTPFGSFIAVLGDDDWLESPTLPQLRTDLEKVVQERLKEIAIPFAVVTARSGVRKGIVRGIHANTGGFLVTWESGIKESIGRSSDFWEVPSDAQESRLAEIVKETDKLMNEAKVLIGGITKISGNDMAEKVRRALVLDVYLAEKEPTNA